MGQQVKSNTAFKTALVMAWLVIITFGFTQQLLYEFTPGKPLSRAINQEVFARKDSLLPDRLLMFVHPYCPCSKASIHELAELSARLNVAVKLQIYVLAFDASKQPVELSENWKFANEIAGAEVVADAGGREARRHGVWTSGTLLRLDDEGRVLFQGGITKSRGHSGQTATSRSLVEQINKRSANPIVSPVFGCPLFEESEE